MPSASVLLAVPTPPCRPEARAPVPAPDSAHRHGAALGRGAGSVPEGLVGPVAEHTAAPEVEDHSCGNDRHDVLRQRPNREAGVMVLVPAHHSVSRGQAEGTTSRQADGLHPVDHRCRIEEVGFAGAGAAAAHVARRHGAAVDANDRGSCTPAAAAPLVVPDEYPGNVGDVAEAHPF